MRLRSEPKNNSLRIKTERVKKTIEELQPLVSEYVSEPDAVEAALERVYANAKLLCEPSDITEKKARAIKEYGKRGIILIDIGTERRKNYFAIKI